MVGRKGGREGGRERSQPVAPVFLTLLLDKGGLVFLRTLLKKDAVKAFARLHARQGGREGGREGGKVRGR